jgi:AcrR family transcriptional regulator
MQYAEMSSAGTKAKRSRDTYHHGDLATTLVEIAKAMISERGLERFTLREAARRAGVTHVAAYRHFADRRAIVAAVAEQGFDQLGRRLERARRGAAEDLAQQLRAILAAYVKFCWNEPALAAVMFGPRLGQPGEFPRLEAAVFASLGIIEETVATLAPRSALRRRTARDLALALWTFVHGFATLSHDKRAFPNARQAASAFDEMLTPMLIGMFGRADRKSSRRLQAS